MLLSKKIKIDVTEKEKEALEFMQNKCRGLYNWLLGQLRDGKKWNLYEAKKSLASSRLYDPELQ